jgi:hypothetical protein
LKTSLGSIFETLLRALAESDPAGLEAIVQDQRHELPLALAGYQKLIGEVLVAIWSGETCNPERLGWLLIELAEVSECWGRVSDPHLL